MCVFSSRDGSLDFYLGAVMSGTSLYMVIEVRELDYLINIFMR